MKQRIVTAAQMKAIEQAGNAHGLPYLQMMENAGLASYAELQKQFPQPGSLLVVCVLLPFSTWAVFYASLFFEQDFITSAGYTSGIDAYMHAIPFCFYPIITLIIVLLFALGIMPKVGAMKKAYQRVAETGKVYSDEELDVDVDAPITIAETDANIPVCTVSEAVMYMDLVNECAIMFRNSSNGHISMVYRRKDGNIGWVEPKADK